MGDGVGIEDTSSGIGENVDDVGVGPTVSSPGRAAAKPNRAEEAEFPTLVPPFPGAAKDVTLILDSGWVGGVLALLVEGPAEVIELTLSLRRDALLPIQLPTVLPHAENATVPLPAAPSPVVVDAAVTFVAFVFVEEMEAMDAKLSGRSFLSPPLVEAITEGGNEGSGCDCCDCGDAASGGLGETALEVLKGLANEGIPNEPCRCDTTLVTPPRTPSTALKKLLDPTEKTFVSASRVGASC